MTVKKCIMTNSRCYRETTEDPKHGIIVHSTGANNTSLKRYVQPSPDDPEYKTIIADIGLNANRNSWNQTNVAKGVHAFVGKNKAGKVEVYQVLPYEKNAWGVAAGPEGSVNYGPFARIQFEICEDGLKNKTYFEQAMTAAIEYCVEICKERGWNETDIWSHKEAIAHGFGSGSRVDIDYWLGKFGKSMAWFRREVKQRLETEELKVGDKIMLKPEATVWGKTTKFSSWVYKSVLTVLRITGDRVWFSIYPQGPTTGTTDVKYCIKV